MYPSVTKFMLQRDSLTLKWAMSINIYVTLSPMMSCDSLAFLCVFSSCSVTKLKLKSLGHSAWPQSEFQVRTGSKHELLLSPLLLSEPGGKGHGPLQAQPLRRSSVSSKESTVASSQC